MDKNEMRAIRREWINYFIHWNHFQPDKLTLSEIKFFIRHRERKTWGLELKAYA